MSYLYHAKTGEVVAVFEGGKVYRDVWKKRLIGSYKNQKIFLGKGIFKKQVGSYNGDISNYITGPFEFTFENKIGYVLGDNVYSGTIEKESEKIAYFISSDKFGAAAAALLSGMFERDKKIDKEKT